MCRDHRVEDGGHGVEDSHVEAVGDDQEDVVDVAHQPLDGSDVVCGGGGVLGGRR